MSKECVACGQKQGELHIQGCDMEPCSLCKGQVISCGCEEEGARVPVGFNPINDTVLWEEYLVPIVKKGQMLTSVGKGFPGCGLCENSGMITIHGGVEKPCICPNGRAIKNVKYN